MIHDVHDLRRFCSRTSESLEKGTLADLKSGYERYKQHLDNLDKEIAVSKLRRHRFSWEMFSPYEDQIQGRYAVSYYLAIFAIGILSYGYLEMVESFIEYLPTRDQFSLRRPVSGLLGMILPLPPDLRDEFYLPYNLEELRAWYDEHKDKLIWDEENSKFYIPETEEDE
ncbi:MAG: hypothetical protein Phog2KO_27190 [Phototrophicaceae bacterium]